jgi:hypothetical protein
MGHHWHKSNRRRFHGLFGNSNVNILKKITLVVEKANA